MKTTSSDPGTGAVLTPACKTKGLYFNDDHEPENFKYIFDKDIDEHILRQAAGILINGSFDSVEDYFDYHLGLCNTEESLIGGTSDNNVHLIELGVVDSSEEDSDDNDDTPEYTE